MSSRTAVVCCVKQQQLDACLRFPLYLSSGSRRLLWFTSNIYFSDTDWVWTLQGCSARRTGSLQLTRDNVLTTQNANMSLGDVYIKRAHLIIKKIMRHLIVNDLTADGAAPTSRTSTITQGWRVLWRYRLRHLPMDPRGANTVKNNRSPTTNFATSYFSTVNHLGRNYS